ncbi:MAG: hypothetical protein K1X65_00370 [Caldilineales bacterium]|nr:hypothetical protein [Caldilineales bacterium]MCW5858816.1 hypothetical protein [Caldilineales bacterium]
MPAHPSPKFYLGAITILQDAEAALRLTGEPAAAYLYEHAYNTADDAIDPDQPVVNAYTLPNGVQLIVITDRTRTQTVVLTPRDRPTTPNPQAF